MNSTTPFLDEVLQGIQPDIITELRGRLEPRFAENIQIQAHQSALTLLGTDTYAVVCVQNPKYPEQDFLFVKYQKNPDNTYSISDVFYLRPEEVMNMRHRNVIP